MAKVVTGVASERAHGIDQVCIADVQSWGTSLRIHLKRMIGSRKRGSEEFHEITRIDRPRASRVSVSRQAKCTHSPIVNSASATVATACIVNIERAAPAAGR